MESRVFCGCCCYFLLSTRDQSMFVLWMDKFRSKGMVKKKSKDGGESGCDGDQELICDGVMG